MKIKLLSAILLIATLLSVASCAKDIPDAETTATTTEDVSAEPVLAIPLAQNGKAEYKVINESAIKEDTLNLLFKFLREIEASSGASFTRGADTVYSDVDYASKPEIIFGAANRDECREVYNSIGYDGYAVKRVGNKIVIAGYTYDKLKLAVESFFTQCIRVDTSGETPTLYYDRDVVCEGSEGLFFTEENPLSSYKIIYAQGNSAFASRLAMAIEERTGIAITPRSDKEPAGEYEILIGDTNREESQGVSPNTEYEYAIKAVGKKLVITTEASSVEYYLIPTIMNTFMYSSPELNFPKDIDKSLIKYAGIDRAVLTEGADIRIMSFNILADDFHTDKNLSPRAPGVIGCVQYYKPDVIGIQEVSRKWYLILLEELADEYEFINTDVIGGIKNNYTGLAYRKDTVEHIDTDHINYKKPGNSRIRLLNVGVFKHKATGKDFVVTSTHLSVGADKNIERLLQAEEHLAAVEKYLWMYQCPVISTGDYNCRESSDPYQFLTGNGVIKNSKYTAQSKGLVCYTHHSMGSKPSTGVESIDHIFYAGNVTPLYFSTLVDDILLITADHTPLICDFKLD